MLPQTYSLALFQKNQLPDVIGFGFTPFAKIELSKW